MFEHFPLVTIFGGNGFLGRHIARRMADRDWRVRVACRRPNEALFVRTYGVVGQVEPVQANIRDEHSTRAAIRGADFVVNCVGLLFEKGRNTFEAVHVEGARRIARIAAEEGVAHVVHISALGADRASDSAYARTKALGEEAVREAFPGAVILRPSVLFGPDDGFFCRFARMAQLMPLVLPVVGAETRFQPAWVEDVAEAAVMGSDGEAPAGIYELGGPNIYTLREAVKLVLRLTHRRRLIIDMPFWMAAIQAWFLEWLPTPPLTRDQVRLLRRDNVLSGSLPGFAELGIEPIAPEGVIEDYLWAYSPEGQYSKLMEDAAEDAGKVA